MSGPENRPPQRHPAEPADRPGATLPPAGAAAAQRRIDSARLFNGAAEVEIEHRAQIYRLRQTALGKLILTK